MTVSPRIADNEIKPAILSVVNAMGESRRSKIVALMVVMKPEELWNDANNNMLMPRLKDKFEIMLQDPMNFLRLRNNSGVCKMISEHEPDFLWFIGKFESNVRCDDSSSSESLVEMIYEDCGKRVDMLFIANVLDNERPKLLGDFDFAIDWKKYREEFNDNYDQNLTTSKKIKI